VLQTSAGCIMPAGVAELIARRLSGTDLTDSHRLAHGCLDGSDARRRVFEGWREDILLARWRHAQAADWKEKIRENGEYLLRLYHSQLRAHAFLGIFDQIIAEQRELPDRLRIAIGWAYLSQGRSSEAIAWLNELDPDKFELASDAAW